MQEAEYFPEMRKCEKCDETKLVLIHFMHKKEKNTCKECKSKAAKEYRRKTEGIKGKRWDVFYWAPEKRKDPRDVMV
jgi:hypothetical protein